MKYTIAIILASLLVGCGGTSSSDSGATGGTTGKGGSMARFAISGDYLYALNKREMEIFYLGNPSAPQPESKVHVPFDVETLFNYKGYLYIGAESGVYIYEISTPSQPTQVSEYTHTRSCDPVVVSNNNLAFVTLNKGSTCRLNSGENTLQVLDVKNPLEPKLIKTMGMWDPKGLGIDDDNKTLFVCDGVAGLKVFEVTKYDHNETNETRVDIFSKPQDSLTKDVDCYDLIPNNGNLIVSNGDNVRQFDYTHFPMKELGQIK
jgi:hypothetical protein